jgi:serine/threonine-protein kinase
MSEPTAPGAGPELEQLSAALGDEFEIIRLLGRGTTSRVHLAREKALGRLVAVKVLSRAQAADETARKRFEREARAAANLSEQPGIVAVHRFGVLPDDTPYLVMQYVKGRTLEERLAAEGPLPLEQARTVLVQVASALAAAHAEGIVHRDVRPGNVFWDDIRQRSYLSDFGIAAVLATSAMDSARLTQTGQRVGDPRYLSPEQLQDEDLTEQADIYGFGILGYELLSGEGPYEARGTTGLIQAHLGGTPRDLRTLRPEVPGDLADLLVRCLAREPNHRPRAADIVRMLESSGPRDGPAPVPGTGTVQPDDVAELIRRRVPQIVGLTAGFGVTLVGLTAVVWEVYDLPRWVPGLSINTAVAGVLAAAVIGWFHGEKGRQDATPTEFALLGLIAAAWIAASVALVLSGG